MGATAVVNFSHVTLFILLPLLLLLRSLLLLHLFITVIVFRYQVLIFLTVLLTFTFDLQFWIFNLYPWVIWLWFLLYIFSLSFPIQLRFLISNSLDSCFSSSCHFSLALSTFNCFSFFSTNAAIQSVSPEALN